MKVKQLQSLLSQIEPFDSPKIELEQYQTSSEIAASILHAEEDSFRYKSVADLGCGSGILSAGLILLDADYVLGIDVDPDALQVCHRNLTELTDEKNYDLMQCDVRRLKLEKKVDCVLMNPPFGTRNSGIDMLFLEVGLSIAESCVYSLHKRSTRPGIKRRCDKWNVDMDVIAELRFDLPATYRFHKQRSADVEVDFIKFSIR